jgi:hypothetical protein
MDVLVEAMLTSDEFIKMLDKQVPFVTMFLFEKFEGTQLCIDLEKTETKEELMAWIGQNIIYTKFTSVAQASSLFDAMENQIIAIGDKFVPDRLERDLELFEDRIKHWVENHANYQQKAEDWQIALCALGAVYFGGSIRARALKALRVAAKGGPKVAAVYIGAALVVSVACYGIL